MARAAKTAPSKTTAMAQYDEEIARLAKESAEQEAGVGGGKFFSMKAGVLSYDGNDLPDNKIACVILDSRLENVFYTESFDEDNPTPPDCYAFGKDEKTMAPFKEAADPQADKCAECPHNEWGSAEKGRGKACRNIRRLALIPAGTYAKDGEFTAFTAEQLEAAQIAFIKIPPTSITAFAGYVKSLSSGFNKPPCLFFTELSVEADKKTQFRVSFQAIEEVPSEVFGLMLQRNKEASGVIEQPYMKADDTEKTPAKGRGAKPAAKKPGHRSQEVLGRGAEESSATNHDDSWLGLNARVRGATEAECEEMHKAEQVGKRREIYMRRIHSRLNKLRGRRERQALTGQ